MAFNVQNRGTSKGEISRVGSLVGSLVVNVMKLEDEVKTLRALNNLMIRENDRLRHENDSLRAKASA